MEAHWVTEARIVERRIQCTLSNALILPKLKAKLKLVKARTCTSAWLDLCWMYGPYFIILHVAKRFSFLLSLMKWNLLCRVVLRGEKFCWPWQRKFSHRFCQDLNLWPFNHESGTLTTELSPLPLCNMTLLLAATSLPRLLAMHSFFSD